MKMQIAKLIAAAVIVATCGQTASSDILQFDFQGNAGSGLLPGNENPPVMMSPAMGGEVGMGLVYDDDNNILSLTFDFADLTGGLFDAADGGIHIHDAGPVDPFDMNGGIEFNLNSGFANVAEGATSGLIDLDIVLTEAQELELVNGQYYVNIHSAGFGSGELRGNLVLVPEPAAATLIVAAWIPFVSRRRR